MNKKSQFLKMADYMFTILALLIIFIFVFGLISVRAANKQNEIGRTTMNIDNSYNLLIFLKTPVEMDGKNMNMADLIILYNLDKKEERINKIRQEAKSLFSSSRGECWILEVKDMKDENVLSTEDERCVPGSQLIDNEEYETTIPYPDNGHLKIMLRSRIPTVLGRRI